MPITEQRRAELGQCRLQLRISGRTVERLDELCEKFGYSRSEQIEALIDAEVELGPQGKPVGKRRTIA